MADDWARARTVDGQTFVYLDQGVGPVVVLFHGFPDTPYGWSEIAQRLVGAGYRVLAPWLRGYHPETVVDGRGYGAEQIAEDAVRFLDAVQAQRAILVGHDWGASIVYGAASLAPGRVRAIVPIDIPHSSVLKPSLAALWGVRHFVSLRLPWAQRRVTRDDFAYLNTLYQRWAPDWTGPERDESLRRAKECFADPASLLGALAYYRALSPRIPASLAQPPPVRGLVVGGTQLVAAEAFERTARALAPKSAALYFPGAGHWPHRSVQDRFADGLLDFLSGLDPELGPD